jgi:endonuclease YncB( thermonuclease family)
MAWGQWLAIGTLRRAFLLRQLTALCCMLKKPAAAPVPKLQAIGLLSAGLLFVLVHGALLAAEMSLSGQALPSWTGVVTHVVDGDTVHVRPVAGGASRSLRLLGMDAPEICQQGGVAARDALNERVFQRQVQVQVQGTDDYGRDLVRLYLTSEDVGQWMVQRGHAWSYRFRQDAGPYAESERRAQILRRGIYAGLPPENPRDFRRRHGPCPR